jgi:hypothetical protein
LKLYVKNVQNSLINFKVTPLLTLKDFAPAPIMAAGGTMYSYGARSSQHRVLFRSSQSLPEQNRPPGKVSPFERFRTQLSSL